MAFTASVDVEGLRRFNAGVTAELRRRKRRAMAVGGRQLQKGLRDDTRPQLGSRIANTWRLELYGQKGEESPAAFVYSKAPAIAKGQQGGTIYPLSGGGLAIPTDKVPRRRGRGGQARMSPIEVEAHFNQELIIRPGKNPGTQIALIDANISAVRGRRRSKRVRLVHMFTFKRNVRLPRRINPDAQFRLARTTARRILGEG